tara:strand:- start:1047 stop:1979 length:933 start_codon:yes stop_codon:yes gene_type:complete
VGPNIARGIETAVQGVAKGWEKYQAAKLKKANQKGAYEALKGMGASEEDALGFSKYPEAANAFANLELAQRKVGAYEDSLKRQTDAARVTSNKAIADRADKDRADVIDMAPNLMKNVGGNWVMDPFQVDKLTDGQQKAFATLPDAYLSDLASNNPDLQGAMAYMSLNPGATLDKLTPGQVEAWNKMPDDEKARIQGMQPTQIIRHDTMLPNTQTLHPLARGLEPGRGIIVDAKGNFKSQIDFDDALQSKINTFLKEMQKTTKNPNYQLTAGDLYNLSMGRRQHLDPREIQAMATRYNWSADKVYDLFFHW